MSRIKTLNKINFHYVWIYKFSFLFSLSFFSNISTFIVFVLIFLPSIFSLEYSFKNIKFKDKGSVIILMILSLGYFFLFIFEFTKLEFIEIEKRSFYLFFPLLILFHNKSQRLIIVFIQTNLLALLVFSLYLLYLSFIRLGNTDLNFSQIFSWGNTYINFTNGVHPSYFSSNILIGLIFLNHSVIFDKIFSVSHKIISNLLLVFISIMCLSRLFIVILVIYFVIFSFKKLNYKYLIITLSISCIACMFLINQNFIKERFFNLINIEINTNDNKNAGRLLRWKCPAELIKDNPLGLGLYESRVQLINCYEVNEYKNAYNLLYNIHNEFLNFGLHYGFLGIIFLIYVYVYFMIRSFREGKIYFAFAFMSLFAFSLIENNLSRYYGIIIFTMLIVSVFNLNTKFFKY